MTISGTFDIDFESELAELIDVSAFQGFNPALTLVTMQKGAIARNVTEAEFNRNLKLLATIAGSRSTNIDVTRQW